MAYLVIPLESHRITVNLELCGIIGGRMSEASIYVTRAESADSGGVRPITQILFLQSRSTIVRWFFNMYW